MTRHLHIDLRPPVDYVLDASADESECVEDLGGHFRLSPYGLNRLRRLAGSRFNPGRVVKAFCLAIIVFNIVFWSGQLLRGVL